MALRAKVIMQIAKKILSIFLQSKIHSPTSPFLIKAAASAAENENAKQATLSEGSKLGNQFQELLRHVFCL